MTHVADPENWLKWDENRGVMGLHVYGFPGSGKSNLSNTLMSHCLKQGDMGLMRGSMNCEWRHFTRYDYKINLLVPRERYDTDMSKHFDLANCDFSKVSVGPFDPKGIVITNHLKKGEILVIYDGAFDIASKGWFWAGIFEQLIKRIDKCDIPVIYLDHEAGVLLPEVALSESKTALGHWGAVNKICELFVDFRKNLIRPILLSQLASEINHRIRGKCLYTFIKQGVADKHYPEQVRIAAPKQRVDQYISVVGKGPYIRGNVARKFKEIKSMWKMVSRIEIDLLGNGGQEIVSKKQVFIEALAAGATRKEAIKRAGCTAQHASQILKKLKKELKNYKN